MNRVIFFCDKCGREMDADALYSIWIKHPEVSEIVAVREFSSPPDLELCEKCRADFLAHIEAWKKGGARWK